MPKLPFGELDLVLLKFLNEQPSHGYALLGRCQREISSYCSAARVYHALARLEKQGLIKASLHIQQNSPTRKVYRLQTKSTQWLTQAQQVIAQKAYSLRETSERTLSLQEALARLARAFDSPPQR